MRSEAAPPGRDPRRLGRGAGLRQPARRHRHVDLPAARARALRHSLPGPPRRLVEGSAHRRVTEYSLQRTQVVSVPLEQAFAFFADAHTLEQITPPWLRFRIVEPPDELAVGARLRYRLSLFGIPIRWRTEIVAWNPPRRVVDVQRRGPFLLWKHAHRLTPVENGTEIYDHVRY